MPSKRSSNKRRGGGKGGDNRQQSNTRQRQREQASADDDDHQSEPTPVPNTEAGSSVSSPSTSIMSPASPSATAGGVSRDASLPGILVSSQTEEEEDGAVNERHNNATYQQLRGGSQQQQQQQRSRRGMRKGGSTGGNDKDVSSSSPRALSSRTASYTSDENESASPMSVARTKTYGDYGDDEERSVSDTDDDGGKRYGTLLTAGDTSRRGGAAAKRRHEHEDSFTTDVTDNTSSAPFTSVSASPDEFYMHQQHGQEGGGGGGAPTTYQMLHRPPTHPYSSSAARYGSSGVVRDADEITDDSDAFATVNRGASYASNRSRSSAATAEVDTEASAGRSYYATHHQSYSTTPPQSDATTEQHSAVAKNSSLGSNKDAQLLGSAMPSSGEDGNTSASTMGGGGNQAVIERPDPVRIITNMLLIEKGRKTLTELAEVLDWEKNYEPQFGDLREYVTSYQSIYLLSPVSEMVVLRQLAFDTGHRRPMRPTKKTNIASSIGSCAYSVVSNSLDLEFLYGVYNRRGLGATMIDGDEVLHVFQKGSFDLFLFDDGGIVWWGMERADHWVVEEDFLIDAVATRPAVVDRHIQHDIDELFPVWFTYHVDSSRNSEEVEEKFEENLCFDHFVLPGYVNSETTEVKLAISHALSNAARVDYFEHVSEALHDQVVRISQNQKTIPSLWNHFARKREVLKIEGCLQSNLQLMGDVGDLSEFFWEKPRYTNLYKSTMEMQSVMLRKEWFSSKCEAASTLVQMVDNTGHRMFMIRSDWVLIFLLFVDVLFLLLKLVFTMYFK